MPSLNSTGEWQCWATSSLLRGGPLKPFKTLLEWPTLSFKMIVMVIPAQMTRVRAMWRAMLIHTGSCASHQCHLFTVLTHSQNLFTLSLPFFIKTLKTHTTLTGWLQSNIPHSFTLVSCYLDRLAAIYFTTFLCIISILLWQAGHSLIYHIHWYRFFRLCIHYYICAWPCHYYIKCF